MYNEQQKLRFFETITDNSKVKAEAAFKRVEPYEKKIDTDCACFSAQEILACFKQLNTPSINTLRNIRSALSVYADWCKNQNLLPDGINHYKEIGHPNMIDCLSIRKLEEGYLTEDEIFNLATSMENAFEKVAILLAYEGFLDGNYDAAYMVSGTDIDNGILYLGEKINTLSSLLESYIYEAEEASVYYRQQANGEVRELKFQDGGGPVFKQLYNAIRDYDTPELRQHFFERMFRRIRDYSGERFITIKKLNESGRINAIKSFMKAEGVLKGNETSKQMVDKAKETYLRHKKELDLRYGEILEVGRYFNVHETVFAAK